MTLLHASHPPARLVGVGIFCISGQAVCPIYKSNPPFGALDVPITIPLTTGGGCCEALIKRYTQIS